MVVAGPRSNTDKDITPHKAPQEVEAATILSNPSSLTKVDIMAHLHKAILSKATHNKATSRIRNLKQSMSNNRLKKVEVRQLGQGSWPA